MGTATVAAALSGWVLAAGPAAAVLGPTSGANASTVAVIASAPGFSVTSPISVTFSSAVTGVSSTSLLLVTVGGGVVPSRVTVADATSASIRPNRPLTVGQAYGLQVTAAVTDSSGTSVAWNGTTVRTETTVAAGSAGITETWNRISDATASGGHYDQSATFGDTSSLRFRGSSVSLSAPRGPLGGYGNVYVDGGYAGAVDFHAAKMTPGRVVWQSRPLGNVMHTVSVSVSGNAASGGGSYVYVDNWTAGAKTYQEPAGDPTGRTVDTWSPRVATDATSPEMVIHVETRSGPIAGGSPMAVANVSGATVTVKLCKAPDGGQADVVVDGAVVKTVSLFQSYTSCGYAAYSDALAAGVHSVGVAVTGIVPTGSAGSTVRLDSISVK